MIIEWFYSASSGSHRNRRTSGLVPKTVFRYLNRHLLSKILRISWKFGQRCKISQIIITYKKPHQKLKPNIFKETSNRKWTLETLGNRLFSGDGLTLVWKYSVQTFHESGLLSKIRLLPMKKNNFRSKLSAQQIFFITFFRVKFWRSQWNFTDFTLLTKFSAYSENFWQKMTFQIRVKYWKTVFGTKPEVLPVLFFSY